MLAWALRSRRLPLSTALLVEGSSLSSRNTRAFSRLGLFSLSRLLPRALNRRTRRRNSASRLSAVCALQRRSNKRYTSSMIARNARSCRSPLLSRPSSLFCAPLSWCRTNRCRLLNRSLTRCRCRAIALACACRRLPGRPRGCWGIWPASRLQLGQGGQHRLGDLLDDVELADLVGYARPRLL